MYLYHINPTNYFSVCSKPRIISLYTELTSLKMLHTESVTDYVLRAETASSRLNWLLLVAMILKGMPEKYRAFATIINKPTPVMKCEPSLVIPVVSLGMWQLNAGRKRNTLETL